MSEVHVAVMEDPPANGGNGMHHANGNGGMKLSMSDEALAAHGYVKQGAQAPVPAAAKMEFSGGLLPESAQADTYEDKTKVRFARDAVYPQALFAGQLLSLHTHARASRPALTRPRTLTRAASVNHGVRTRIRARHVLHPRRGPAAGPGPEHARAEGARLLARGGGAWPLAASRANRTHVAPSRGDAHH
jgi:hypothetical protein